MYGPMQFLAIGFPGNEFSGEIIPALEGARDKGLIRLIDYAFVMKDEDGNMMSVEGSDLGPAQVERLGAAVGALIGLGAGGEKGAEKGASIGAEIAKEDEMEDLENEVTYGVSQDDIDDVLDSFPSNSSALFVIIEHLWAKGLKQAVRDSDGTVLAQGLLTPELFVQIGEALSMPTIRGS
ncbi:MAG: DUF6325 family protein [Methanomassiliicoccus sp.]|nr:DUF6325 family protein [Methanomassiliicoccus sp.]